MSEKFRNTQAIRPRPSSPWDKESSTLQWVVYCPVCGEMGLDRASSGGDHKSVTVYPDRDAYDSPLGTRGGYVQIDLGCPAGHMFALVIANHKGMEVIGMAPLRESQPS